MARTLPTLAAIAAVFACAHLALAQKARPEAGPADPAPSQARRPAPPALGAPGSPIAGRVQGSRIRELAKPAAPQGGCFTVQIDPWRLADAAATPGALQIEQFPVGVGQTIDLEVERFWVTKPGTRFVAGGPDGRDVPLNFDPDSIVLLRGRVVGYPHSNVYLAMSDILTNGVIDLGKGSARYGVSSRGPGGRALPSGMVSVFAAAAGGPNPMMVCSVIDTGEPVLPGGGDSEPVKGLRQIQLAVETDHEFFQLFNDETATAAYIVELYGAVSDIMMRNINARLDLTFARVWPLPNEPFNPDLTSFRSYWQANMGSVTRDNAQMFSGRGDLPGGVAYLSSICNNNAYSFCGNALGYFADPSSSSVFTYDPLVTAHELGHNFGSQHTDVYGIDNCNLVTVTPRRGTIMSYCNQTVSGGMSVIELDFHKVPRNAMTTYMATRSCAVFDCNQNGISDAVDIAMSTSADVNSNGIPDECEDCNHNGILDTIDIATLTSLDLNANGIPDECEPDCNNNQVPDDRDILLGTSQDLHGDNIPDECDADRNSNSVSDYNEIMADMTLDKDRDRIIDTTQDCNNNGIPDLVELEGARDGWVASLAAENALREFHSITGVLMGISEPGRVNAAQDLIITPDRRVLVSSAGANKVVEFNRLGAFVRDLIPAGSGGLASPAGMLIAPWGNLLVSSAGSNAVLEYNLATGAFIRVFVGAGSGGLASPFGLTFRSGGNLFVSSLTQNRVYEYDRATGAFIRIFVAGGAGGLATPRGLVFNPLTGNLLVASFGADQVKEYNSVTGAFIRDWLITGLPIDGPWCMRVGPDGFIYISRHEITDTHFTRARIFIHDPRNGNFVRSFVQGQDSGLANPTGFDFMPGDFTDCNRNQLPDSCDISSGRSSDVNANGIPDECERTCYANCDLSTIPPILNVNDFLCFMNLYAAASPYANCDGSTTPPVLNVNDFTCYLNAYAAGCP